MDSTLALGAFPIARGAGGEAVDVNGNLVERAKAQQVLKKFVRLAGKTELRPDPLSPRERQVLQLIAEGKTTKEVATFLQISVKTAETHRTRIMTKLNIHETAGLVRYAIRSGLTQA